MRKLLLSSIFIGLTCFAVAQQTHIILAGGQSGTEFVPDYLEVDAGDTVRFIYETGYPHTTTSTSIPVGATPWDAPLVTTGDQYDVVPTVVGTYEYECTPHALGGMVGTFVVNSSTEVQELDPDDTRFDIYPNKVGEEFVVDLYLHHRTNAEIVILNLLGAKVKTIHRGSVKGTYKRWVNISNLPKGIYVVRFQAGNKLYSQRLIKQ